MAMTSLAAPSGAIMAPGRGGVMTNYRLSDYDKKRLDEQNRANLPAFWIVYFVVFGGLALYFLMNSG